MRTTYIANLTEAANLHSGKQTAIVTMVKPQPTFTNKDELIKVNSFIEDGDKMRFVAHSVRASTSPLPIKLPYQPGQTIAVRESWGIVGEEYFVISEYSKYKDGNIDLSYIKWRSPATMPIDAVHTHLMVKDVLCVRVQDMTSEQAQAIWPDMSNIERMQDLHRKFGSDAWVDNVFVFITKVEKI